jgi:hypothetical protein
MQFFVIENERNQKNQNILLLEQSKFIQEDLKVTKTEL